MANRKSISIETLVDQDVPPHPPAVTVDDLPDLHEQLLVLTDRGRYVVDAARLLARLHDTLIGYPHADPRSASRVVHEVVLGLRRGPLPPTDDMYRYDVAHGWLDNIYMRSREPRQPGPS
jgi:hypothetical protein